MKFIFSALFTFACSGYIFFGENTMIFCSDDNVKNAYHFVDNEFSSEELRALLKYKLNIIDKSDDVEKIRDAVSFILDIKCDGLSIWVACKNPGEIELYFRQRADSLGYAYVLAMAAIKKSYPEDFSSYVPQAWGSIHFIKIFMKVIGYNEKEIDFEYEDTLAYRLSVEKKIKMLLEQASLFSRTEKEEVLYKAQKNLIEFAIENGHVLNYH